MLGELFLLFFFLDSVHSYIYFYFYFIYFLIYHKKRQIFNRIVQLGLTAKRMKFIFKKYMDFEKAHGSDESVEKVKELALKYAAESNVTDDNKQSSKTVKGDEMEMTLKKNLKI